MDVPLGWRRQPYVVEYVAYSPYPFWYYIAFSLIMIGIILGLYFGIAYIISENTTPAGGKGLSQVCMNTSECMRDLICDKTIQPNQCKVPPGGRCLSDIDCSFIAPVCLNRVCTAKNTQISQQSKSNVYYIDQLNQKKPIDLKKAKSNATSIASLKNKLVILLEDGQLDVYDPRTKEEDLQIAPMLLSDIDSNDDQMFGISNGRLFKAQWNDGIITWKAILLDFRNISSIDTMNHHLWVHNGKQGHLFELPDMIEVKREEVKNMKIYGSNPYICAEINKANGFSIVNNTPVPNVYGGDFSSNGEFISIDESSLGTVLKLKNVRGIMHIITV